MMARAAQEARGFPSFGLSALQPGSASRRPSPCFPRSGPVPFLSASGQWCPEKRKEAVMATSSEDRANVYTRVTNQIIQAIEAGTDSWIMPWHAGDKAFRFPVNVATGKRYRGVKVISLWAAADVHSYP